MPRMILGIQILLCYSFHKIWSHLLKNPNGKLHFLCSTGSSKCYSAQAKSNKFSYEILIPFLEITTTLNFLETDKIPILNIALLSWNAKKQVYAAVLLFFKSAFILTEGVKMLVVILKEFLQVKFAESWIV